MKTLWKKINGVVAKFFLDALALVVGAFVSSTGLVLYLILPHGSGNMQSRGALRHGVKMLWGMDRQQWGFIHLILSLILLAIVLFHIIQHWRWLKGFFLKKLTATPRTVFLSFILVITIISFAPFVTQTTIYKPTQTDTQPQGRRGGRKSRTAQTKAPSQKTLNGESREQSLDLRGKDTIATVAEKLSIEPIQVKQLLDLPETIADDTRMSDVKTRLNMSMSGLRKALSSDR